MRTKIEKKYDGDTIYILMNKRKEILRLIYQQSINQKFIRIGENVIHYNLKTKEAFYNNEWWNPQDLKSVFKRIKTYVNLERNNNA